MRNLEPAEIYDQVIAIDKESRLYYNHPLSIIVFSPAPDEPREHGLRPRPGHRAHSGRLDLQCLRLARGVRSSRSCWALKGGAHGLEA